MRETRPHGSGRRGAGTTDPSCPQSAATFAEVSICYEPFVSIPVFDQCHGIALLVVIHLLQKRAREQDAPPAGREQTGRIGGIGEADRVESLALILDAEGGGLGIDRAAFAAALSLNSRLSSPWRERLGAWEAELAVHQAQAALPARDRVTDC
jgi:hypothetical protein